MLLIAAVLASVLIVVIWSCVEAVFSFLRHRRERVIALNAQAFLANVEKSLRQLISQRFNCSEDEFSRIRSCIRERQCCIVVDPAGIIEVDDYMIAQVDLCAAGLGLQPMAGAPGSLTVAAADERPL
jgi:hypothetical protein